MCQMGGIVLHSFISFYFILFFFLGVFQEPLFVAGTVSCTARGGIRVGRFDMGACAQHTAWASFPHASPLAPQHISAGRLLGFKGLLVAVLTQAA